MPQKVGITWYPVIRSLLPAIHSSIYVFYVFIRSGRLSLICVISLLRVGDGYNMNDVLPTVNFTSIPAFM